MRMAWAGAWAHVNERGQRMIEGALGVTRHAGPPPPSHRDGRHAVRDLLKLNRLAGPRARTA
jgi:hypothetical protein